MLVAAFFATHVIWGTTYLGMRIALESFPPFATAASRFILAALIGFVFAWQQGVSWPTRSEWTSAAMIGCLLLVGGNGLVMWAMQRTPSGITALIIASTPIWMTCFDWLFYRGPRPTRGVIFGLISGVIGIALLVAKVDLFSSRDQFHYPSLVLIVLATLSWSFGALHSRHVALPKNILLVTAMESLVGGLILLAVSYFGNESQRMRWDRASWEGIVAVIYLAIFGSLVSLSAYSWLLKQVSASVVSTHTFVNPLIALLLGWLVRNETISTQTALAIVFIILGVILIVFKRRTTSDQSQLATSAPGDPS